MRRATILNSKEDIIVGLLVFILFILFLPTPVLAVEPNIAYSFDYPIGNKGYDLHGNKVPINEHIPDRGNNYNVERNEAYNLEIGYEGNNSREGVPPGSGNWYNVNDVGAFFSDLKGLHPGEDWNYTTRSSEIGQPVYSIGVGVIEKISILSRSNIANESGWYVVIKHKLPDNSYIYSAYLHITCPSEKEGNMCQQKINFGYKRGDLVGKGDVIGRIASISEFPNHLHFELRTKFNNKLYENDNGSGYYTDQKGVKRNPISRKEVLEAIRLLKSDGFLDPSDFIDDHREPYFWTGNGSLIAHHAEDQNGSSGRANTSDPEYPFGITKDVTVSHVRNNSKPVGFFQWQVSDSCQHLSINYDGPFVEKTANITIGKWNTRRSDRTYYNTQLPVILNASDFIDQLQLNGTDWLVLSVELLNGVTTSERISASCSSFGQSMQSSPAHAVVFDDGFQWNGNGSIISRTYKDSYGIDFSTPDFGDWPFGAFMDVTMVHKSQYKPVVFFQWMPSAKCSSLTVSVSSLLPSEQGVEISYKSWSSNAEISQTGILPITISSNDLTWMVVRVAFTKPVSRDSRVYAKCPNF